MSKEVVILVDTQDTPIGEMEKMEAHEKGLLHRAFSIFIMNDGGEIMVHQRASSKYHSGGLWTNTCCSHPRPTESVEEAAKRRLQEEMGFECEMKIVDKFIYEAKLDNNLTEHEYDYVLFGTFNGQPNLNPSEVQDWKWMKPSTVFSELNQYPEKYTYWFKVAFDNLIKKGLIDIQE